LFRFVGVIKNISAIFFNSENENEKESDENSLVCIFGNHRVYECLLKLFDILFYSAFLSCDESSTDSFSSEKEVFSEFPHPLIPDIDDVLGRLAVGVCSSLKNIKPDKICLIFVCFILSNLYISYLLW
jgi:hypothetical protein